MKKSIFTILTIAGALCIVLVYSCKKSDNTTTTPTPANTDATTISNNSTVADDNNMYTAESNQTNGDVTSDIETNQSGMARTRSGSPVTQTTSVCGATIDITHIAGDTLIYNFNDSVNCYGRHRSGQIVVSLNGMPFHSANAVLTITFNNYKVTRLWDNKAITFNGSKTVTDITGFTWADVVYLGDTITIAERVNNLHVSFSGGASAVWNSARLSKWSLSGGTVYFTCVGDSVSGSKYISDWGTDRFNQSFVIYETSPVAANSLCGSAFPTSGVVVENVANSTLTLTLGTDNTGTPVNSGCPEYFKIAWVLGDGNNGTAVVHYY